jgi:hypothetical protein
MAERNLVREVPDVAQLSRDLEKAGADALERFVKEIIVPMILAEIPIGDPRLDPDPAVSLREALEVRRVGNTVFIEMDTEYAAVQHFANYEHPRGGKSHFIDHPLQVGSALIERYIGEALERRMQSQRQLPMRGPGGRFVKSPYKID